MDTTLIELAKAIPALGVTGLLAYLFILWMNGKIHSQKEKEDWDNSKQAGYQYREDLRKEAVEDRRESDARLDRLSDALKEQSDLMKRSLDFNERLVEELARTRTGGSRE